MMPMTPSGTRTRVILRPFGRCQSASTPPIGSSSAATTSRPAAVAATRFSSRASRSSERARLPALRVREVLGVRREHCGGCGAQLACGGLERLHASRRRVFRPTRLLPRARRGRARTSARAARAQGSCDRVSRCSRGGTDQNHIVAMDDLIPAADNPRRRRNHAIFGR